MIALLQGIKKLYGPLLDDLDCVSAVKEAIELQVEACMLCPYLVPSHRHLQQGQGHPEGEEGLSGRSTRPLRCSCL